MTNTSLIGVLPVADSVSEAIVHDSEGGLHKELGACNTREIGRYGEDLAAAYLKESGLEVLERNWRCTLGEVDIVAREDSTIILAEVKTRVVREGDAVTRPELAVGYRKRRRYEKLALLYLARNASVDAVRFDVLAVKLVSAHDARIRHLVGAYEMEL